MSMSKAPGFRGRSRCFSRRLLSGLGALLALGLTAGCGTDSDGEPGHLSVLAGDEQCVSLALPPAERVTARPLQVELQTRNIPGWLGGKGERQPVPGTEVLFRIVGRPLGAGLLPVGGEPRAEPAGLLRVRTDGGGRAAVLVRAGNQPGDISVEASLPASPGRTDLNESAAAAVKPVFFRISAGMAREGNDQEASGGGSPADPVAVVLTGGDGRPMPGVPIEWHIEKAPSGTRFTITDTRTDDQGRARAQLQMGDATGQVIVTAVASDPERGLAFLPTRFKLFSLSTGNIVITVLGGLAIFILGMKLMSEGLARVAGARMKAILQAFTKTPLIGVLVGTAVTAVVQSSSATSVMVIGFVNAGLLSLERAIGLIMGANIGTTVTAQMISFKLDKLALPAVALGVAIQLLAKRKTNQHWGMVLTGFGVLFTGLGIMSGVLGGLQHSSTITGFFRSIDCAPPAGSPGMPTLEPLLAIGIGLLVTVIVQSSSAAIGLLLVLVATGLINFYTAVPLLLGSNIGTTTTAAFAVIGANRSARRTAVAHALFNVAGSAFMYGLFYVNWDGHPVFLQAVNAMTAGDAFAGENLTRQVANAHTLFNVVCTLLFLPLVPAIAWTCRKVVPETKDEREEGPRYLEPHLLNTPAMALERAQSELVYMTKLAQKAITQSFGAFAGGSVPDRASMERRESRIDELQHDITDYLVRLSQRSLNESESRQLPLIMHSVNDAERIGDHSENLVELAERRVERRLQFSEEAMGELRELFGEAEVMFDQVIELLESGEVSCAERALHCEGRINDMSRELNINHVCRLEKGECNMVSGVVFLDMIANIEKVGDHLTNIAQAGRALVNINRGE
jgi:phosphate:Na+ symporter